MNEPLDLTTKSPQKKWYSRPWVIGIIVLAFGLIIYFGLSGRDKTPETPFAYGEDQLPAIKVVVLNGCGYEQLAREYANSISELNIDVVSLGDTPKPIYDKSIIVVRKGDDHDLSRLMKMTGIKRWTSALNEYHSADFEIIIGRDFDEFMK